MLSLTDVISFAIESDKLKNLLTIGVKWRDVQRYFPGRTENGYRKRVDIFRELDAEGKMKFEALTVLVEARVSDKISRQILGLDLLACTKRWNQLKDKGWNIFPLTLDGGVGADRGLADLILNGKSVRLSKAKRDR